MTKIDIVSGFLGAGKTTLIKKLISEAFHGEKLVIIENEFGQIAIDGGFLKESGVQITEMNSGCICCSLVGDFSKSLKEVVATYSPDRIIIEPSGVGKLSDVIKAVEDLDSHDLILNSATTVVDAKKCKVYSKNFGEFFNNQLEHAHCVILSRSDDLTADKLNEVLELIHAKNDHANVITTSWASLNGQAIVKAMSGSNHLEEKLTELAKTHHHHHHDDCKCGCCHHDHHHEHEHHHDHIHHHEHKPEHPHECHHHHGHDHHHDHHEHHHADEVFSSWGCQTPRRYSKDEIHSLLSLLNDTERFGHVLRAKGIVNGKEDCWYHFDFVPEESEVREGGAEITGSICVIGSDLKEDALSKLFV